MSDLGDTSGATHEPDSGSAKLPRITAKRFLDALYEAGYLRPGDYVRRVVIDAPFDGAVVVHVERVADERVLDVASLLSGVQVREVDRA